MFASTPNLTYLSIQSATARMNSSASMIAQFPKLESLFFFGTKIFGTLPSDIGLMSLKRFTISGTGSTLDSVPTEIGLIQSLYDLDLSGMWANDLTKKKNNQINTTNPY